MAYFVPNSTVVADNAFSMVLRRGLADKLRLVHFRRSFSFPSSPSCQMGSWTGCFEASSFRC